MKQKFYLKLSHPVFLSALLLMLSVFSGTFQQETPSTNAAALAVTTINFEDRPVGTRITNQYSDSGVIFPDGGFIRSIQQGPLTTQSPPQFLEKDCFEFDEAPLRIQFTRGQGWVGVYVGNPENFEQTAVMRAYDAMTGGRLIGTAQVTLGARANITTLLQICRAVDRDIRRVEISVGRYSCEIIDDLSFDPDPLSRIPITTATFDDRPESTRITTQYPGLNFPAAPWIRTAASLGTTTITPPNVLEQYSYGLEFDRPPLQVELTRPQAWVRTYVRGIAGCPRVEMRAYSRAGRSPLVTTSAEFSGNTPVNTPLELCRLVERDINRVEIEYVPSCFEVIDNFQFAGTSPPPPPRDSQAPRVFIDAPRTGDFFYRRNIVVRGRITENDALEQVTLVHEQLDGTGRREDPTVLRLVSGRAPNFTFEFHLDLFPGRNRIRIEATDRAGNRATNPEREIIVTLAPPMQVIIDSPKPYQVFSFTPIIVQGRVRKQFGTLTRDRVRIRVSTTRPDRSTPFESVGVVEGTAPEFHFTATRVALFSGGVNQTNTLRVEAISEDGVVASAEVDVVYSLPDVSVLELDVIQAHHSGRLVAGKGTVVRVYPKVEAWMGGSSVNVRRVQLIGRRGGMDLPGSPLQLDSNLTIVPNEPIWAKVRDVRKTWNFLLPNEWTQEGEIELIARINPDGSLRECDRCSENNEFRRTHVRFTSRNPFNVQPILISVRGGPRPDPSVIPQSLIAVQRVYPTATVHILPPSTFDTSLSLADDFSMGVLAVQLAMRVPCVASLLVGAIDPFFGLFNFLLCEWDTSIYGIVPPRTSRRVGLAIGPGSFGWAGVPFAAAAHELGHTLLRAHAPGHGEDRPDSRFPDPHGGISGSFATYGFDAVAMQVIPPRQDGGWPAGIPTIWMMGVPAALGDHAHDFMSYGGDPVWISSYTWEGLFDQNFRASLREALSLLTVSSLTGTDRQLSKTALARPRRIVAIQGFVSETGTVNLGPFYTDLLPDDATLPVIEGTYRVEIQNRLGTALASAKLGVINFSEGQGGLLAAFVPLPDESARVVVKDPEGNIVAERSVSANAPEVTLIHPNGGEMWPATGRQTIIWNGRDADGDVLTYAVQYSQDGGMTWRTIASELTEPQFEVDVSNLPGSEKAKVRVIATDGVNTSRDTSDATFTVEPKPPFVLILAPENDFLFPVGQRIRLEGTASDLEDGVLPDSALQWSSDKDGPLGAGRILDLNRLSPGLHTITLSAHDSDGREGRASITVRVATQLELKSETGLEGSVDNARRVDTKSGIGVGNGPKLGQPPREQVVRGFVSFDLTTLPKDVEIIEARVELFQKDITGDPYFKGLGGVVVDAVDYGPSLDADDFDAPALLKGIGTLSDNGLLEFKGLDVTEAVKTALANERSRVQFRLRFGNETDGDGNIDAVVFEAATSAATASMAPKLILIVAPIR